MPITPDDKDWTWVLERTCPECGFTASAVDATDVAGLIRENAGAWRPLLDGHQRLADRPSDDRWSALEYACHVRDVYRLYDERLTLMRTLDAPTFPNWDQDVTAVEDRYNTQDPIVVVTDLEAAARQLADNFDAVTGDAWQRTGLRSDGAHFTVESFARYLIHDPVHHLDDVERGFAALDCP